MATSSYFQGAHSPSPRVQFSGVSPEDLCGETPKTTRETPVVFGIESAGAKEVFLSEHRLRNLELYFLLDQGSVGGCAKPAVNRARSGKESWGDGV